MAARVVNIRLITMLLENLIPHMLKVTIIKTLFCQGDPLTIESLSENTLHKYSKHSINCNYSNYFSTYITALALSTLLHHLTLALSP